MPNNISLSIIVIVYRMKPQAYNTLYSLSEHYQRNVRREEYEVIVVENASKETLDAERIAELAGNFRYFLRHETGVSPAAAINFGLAQARGRIVGLVIDGAHMLSPGVLQHVFAAARIAESPLVLTPGYHLSSIPLECEPAHRAEREQALLEQLRWRENGYALFSQARFSPGNKLGLFHPFMECNALFATAGHIHAIGGADEAFDLPGGGSLNLHICRNLGLQPDSRLFVLPGEGSFHQYHGGVTTAAGERPDALIRQFQQQLNGFWGGQFKALAREPILLGKVGLQAQRFLQSSCEAGQRRFVRLREENKPPFPDDPPATSRPTQVTHADKPLISVVVIVYKMRRQAMNTLYSLSTAFQQGVAEQDYEIIVVENASDQLLVPEEVGSLGGNLRYHRRDEPTRSPVGAINFGVDDARADHVCLMIDGARLVTPRLIRNLLDILALTPTPLIAAPGYHLGQHDQKHSQSTGYDENVEMALLKSIDWQHNGYALFDIACVSGANTHGVFHPLMECNCLTFAKADFIATGGAHPGFQTPGGGSVNLDIYRNLALLPHSRLFVLPGEGSFHQYHGGITTSESADLEQVLASHREELVRIRGVPYSAVQREPTLYGAVAGPALRFLHESSLAGQRRLRRFEHAGNDPWQHDAPVG